MQICEQPPAPSSLGQIHVTSFHTAAWKQNLEVLVLYPRLSGAYDSILMAAAWRYFWLLSVTSSGQLLGLNLIGNDSLHVLQHRDFLDR